MVHRHQRSVKLSKQPCAHPEKSIRGREDPENFYSHELILQRAIRTSLEKLLNPRGPIASRSGGGEGGPCQCF